MSMNSESYQKGWQDCHDTIAKPIAEEVEGLKARIKQLEILAKFLSEYCGAKTDWDTYYCDFCEGNEWDYSSPEMHDPDCPVIVARKLVGESE